jgi:hypothetical protein
MNCSDKARHGVDTVQILPELLTRVRTRFYANVPQSVFAAHRRRLIYALTWPAHWMERRALACTPLRYRALVEGKLEAIALHGDPGRYGEYFPSYLLRCLQDHFQRQGGELDSELRHIAGAMELARGALHFAPTEATARGRQVEALAQVHRLLRVQAAPEPDPRQMALF